MGRTVPETPSPSWTLLKLLNWTQEYLARHDVDSPRLAAEVLLAHCLRCRRVELYTRFNYKPSADELASYRGLVKRAARHEPVAYLVGRKEFYSLGFKVTPAVLVPRPESELLVTAALEHLRDSDRTGKVWDVCTGCGCVAVAVASQATDAEVLATDISPEAIAVAAENAKAHNVANRVHCCVADLLALPKDAPESFAKGHFDVITANPPYVGVSEPVAKEVLHEPKIALYAESDGLKFVGRIIAEAPAHLTAGGILAIEFGYKQADDVRDLLIATGAFDEPRILRDHNGVERTAVANKKRQTAESAESAEKRGV